MNKERLFNKKYIVISYILMLGSWVYFLTQLIQINQSLRKIELSSKQLLNSIDKYDYHSLSDCDGGFIHLRTNKKTGKVEVKSRGQWFPNRRYN